MDFVKHFTITKEPGSQVKIVGEIPFAELEKERSQAIAHLGTDIELDGFRKGKVPEKVLVGKLGEMRILSEMAERALARIYPHILKEHAIDAIGYPAINITKLAPQNPLGITLTVAVLPDITLPDYKHIAADVNKTQSDILVTDEEVDDQAKDILRQKVAYERLQEKAKQRAERAQQDAVPNHLGDATDLPTPESIKADVAEETEPEIPELTDEYVKTLGQPGQFETVADFKAKLREHLTIEKEREQKAAHRAKITDAIIEKTTCELPQVMIDSEIGQMFAQMEDDLTRAQLKIDDYLQHIKKTREELTKEWQPAAEKRAKLQLILNEIAKVENIEPDKTELETQVKQLLEQYKDADEARVRVYIASILMNEAVMKMLEEQE